MSQVLGASGLPQLPNPPAPTVQTVDSRLYWAVTASAIGLCLLFLVFIFLATQADWTVGSTWLWAVSGVIATGVLIREIVQSLRWHSKRIVFGSTTLQILSKGRPEVEIPYGSISGYTFQDEKPDEWLRIDLIDQPSVVISHRPTMSNPLTPDRKEFVRGIGPRLSKDASQDLGERPSSRLEAYLREHFYSPPMAELRPGSRFRYLLPNELQQKVIPMASLIPCMGLVGHIPILLIRLFVLRNGAEWVTGALVFNSLAAVPCVLMAVRQARFRRSFFDQIEVVPEGLRITRMRESWLVPGPATSTRSLLALRFEGKPLVRYGCGRNTYYLDPRYLVSDD